LKHYNNFDLIRLLAACQVLYSHSIEHLKLPSASIPVPLRIIMGGFPGVAVFFVISGFLISRSWLNSSMSLRVFADHRVRRIYPALWVNMAVLFAACIITGSVVIAFPKLPLFIIGTFIGGSDEIGQRLAGWIFNKGTFYEFFPSGVLWTLPVELGFYLLVPVIFSRRYKSSKDRITAIGWWTAGSLVLQFVWQSQGPFSIFRFLWVFLLGAALNLCWDRVRPFVAGKAIYWVAAYYALVSVLHYFGLSTDYRSPTVSAILATSVLGVMVVSIAYSFLPLSGVLGNQDISYGVYLWHMPIIWTMIKFGYVGSWTCGACAYALTAVIAALSWVLVEKPALRGKLPASRIDASNPINATTATVRAGAAE
jgi:peptidoglycan/LPS O-acetylase OafA/YrhL